MLLRKDNGLLIGLFPLMLERRFGITRLMLLGTGVSDYLDILVRDGHAPAISHVCARVLDSVPGNWGIADLQLLRDGASAWSLFRKWDGPALRLEQGVCPVIEVRSWEEMVHTLSSNRRSTARRAINRLHLEGAVCAISSPDDIEVAALRFVELHRSMWSGRDVSPMHLTKEFENHIVDAARRMTYSGTGAISEFRKDGEVFASHFLTIGKDSVGHLLSGATRKALKRYQISSLFVWDGTNIARDKGLPRFDFLRGDEDYKFKWKPEIVPLERAILGRKSLAWLTFLVYQGSGRMNVHARRALDVFGRARKSLEKLTGNRNPTGRASISRTRSGRGGLSR